MPKPPAPGPAADSPPPIGQAVEAAFARRLDPDARAPLVLGLSGGGDSLALLLLAHAWAARHARPLLALSVDHRLHPDSARWTAFAGEAAARIGAQWRALAWEGEKPRSGLPAAARAARHRLLAQATREAGARVLLLGHTADDVAEGERMRARDAPALGRLREWGPSPAWPEGREVFVLRPLLSTPRAALRAFLAAEGWSWLDDPANEDLQFARARARRALQAKDGDTPLRPAVDLSAGPAQGASGWSATPDGRLLLVRRGLDVRVLAAALLCAGGGDVPPRGVRLKHLVERLEGGGPVTASLAGARISADADTVQVGREAGERARGGLAPVGLEPGRAVVWDGRFEATALAPGWSVGPLAGAMARLGRTERAWLKSLPASARSALPVLTGPDGARALPHPFGAGPAAVRSLVGDRFAAACGAVIDEGPRLGESAL